MSLTNIDGQPIPNPNTYTAVGALCIDAILRRELFHSQTPGIQDVLLNLPETEFQTFMSLASKGPGNPPESDYAAVGMFYCRKPPCPFAIPNIETVLGAAILDDGFRAAWFNDPHQAHVDYGFDLTENEDVIIVTHLGQHKKPLREKIEVLGGKLKAILGLKLLATTSAVARKATVAA